MFTPHIWPMPMRPGVAPQRRDLRIAIGQIRVPVGDLDGNAKRIGEAMAWAEGIDADVLLLPELAITGYPPEDLLHRPDFVGDNLAVLGDLAEEAGSCLTIVGFVDPIENSPGPDTAPRYLANAVALLQGGEVRGRYHKVLLPNYGVFGERRYFAAGERIGGTWSVNGTELGILICEDLWRNDLPDAQAGDGAQAVLSVNASPYHRGKQKEREATVTGAARRCGMPVAYAAGVGGEESVVFDGGSVIADARGQIVARAPHFEEAHIAADVALPEVAAPQRSTFICRRLRDEVSPPLPGDQVAPLVEGTEEVYRTLVVGVADFVGERTAVLGLSGGIDSALLATIAADALGPDRVRALTMPGPQTPAAATADAQELGRRLRVRTDIVPISELVEGTAAPLEGIAAPDDATKDDIAAARESLPATIRAGLLHTLATRLGGLVLEPANKTETALGYAGSGGLMAGGFAPLKDLPKTVVYELARWRTAIDGSRFGWPGGSGLIPSEIIERPPSARRTPDLPHRELPAEYATLDAILERFIERSWSPDAIVADGYDRAVVQRVVELVEQNEHTRAQLPPGVKVSGRGFGRDRRMPVQHAYHPSVTPRGEHRTDLDAAQLTAEELWLEG